MAPVVVVRVVDTTGTDSGIAGTTEAVEGRTSAVMLIVSVVEQVLRQLSAGVRHVYMNLYGVFLMCGSMALMLLLLPEFM